MARTDNLRAHHKTILADLAALDGLLSPQTLANQAKEARSLLSNLAGKITLHLAMEDTNLYPIMIASSDANAKAAAQSFKTEMGGLGQAFSAYIAKWPSASRIEANPNDFIRDTRGVTMALKQRIEKEEAKLYPLADALE